MDIRHELADLAEAITTQCGLLASYKRLCHQDGAVSTVIQVCTVADSTDAEFEDWRFFEAVDDAGLKRIRDEIGQFIAEHRQEAA